MKRLERFLFSNFELRNRLGRCVGWGLPLEIYFSLDETLDNKAVVTSISPFGLRSSSEILRIGRSP